MGTSCSTATQSTAIRLLGYYWRVRTINVAYTIQQRVGLFNILSLLDIPYRQKAENMTFCPPFLMASSIYSRFSQAQPSLTATKVRMGTSSSINSPMVWTISTARHWSAAILLPTPCLSR
jgi:hypothetical protein